VGKISVAENLGVGEGVLVGQQHLELKRLMLLVQQLCIHNFAAYLNMN